MSRVDELNHGVESSRPAAPGALTPYIPFARGAVGLRWTKVVVAATLLATASDVHADVSEGELYGYRLDEVVEGCGQRSGLLEWSRIPSRNLPEPFDETWALCTPLTHHIVSVSVRARVALSAGLTLVDELVAVLQEKYGNRTGWKHDFQSRELLGTYDTLHTFENEVVLLRISTRDVPEAKDDRQTIVEIQLDRSTYAPHADANEQAAQERLELLRRSARAKGLDEGL